MNLFIIIGMVCATAAHAKGYVKHVWNNNTAYNCFVITHQKFYFPIDACLGAVDSHTTKTCNGPLYLDEWTHVYTVICTKEDNESTSAVELTGTYQVQNNNSQSIELTWNINPTPDQKSIRIALIKKAM